MEKNKDDIGLDRGGQRGRQRTINPDGSYNLIRIGEELSGFEIFHWLINTRWSHFWGSVFVFYGTVNVVFASIYYALGVEQFAGMRAGSLFSEFAQCFFFSIQTYTTVGYGGMHPVAFGSGLVSSIEAFLGLMSFALATGTLYGRFSRPNAKLKYSEHCLVSPTKNGKSLQFMIANQRNSNLMEMEATVNLSWIEIEQDTPTRKFASLVLEVSKIAMFPTSWIINHIIDDTSPLATFTEQDYTKKDVELFILIKGFDETFSQMIYSRHSYTEDEIVWGKKFVRPFHVSESGQLVMNLDKVGKTEDIATL